MAEMMTPNGLVVGLILEDKAEEKPVPAKGGESGQTGKGNKRKTASK